MGLNLFGFLHLKRTRASGRFCCNYSAVTPHISGFTRSLGAEGSCDRQNFLLVWADKQKKPERPVEVGHFWSFQQAGRHCYFEVDIQRLGMHFGWGGGLSRNYGGQQNSRIYMFLYIHIIWLYGKSMIQKRHAAVFSVQPYPQEAHDDGASLWHCYTVALGIICCHEWCGTCALWGSPGLC